MKIESIMLTDGLTSNYTKNTYRNAFNHFIKITVKNDNPRVLLDTKQSVERKWFSF